MPKKTQPGQVDAGHRPGLRADAVGERGGDEEAGGAEDVRRPDEPVVLLRRQIVAEHVARAEVEEQGAGELDRRRPPRGVALRSVGGRVQELRAGGGREEQRPHEDTTASVRAPTSCRKPGNGATRKHVEPMAKPAATQRSDSGWNAATPPAKAFAHTAGFALEDLRKLSDEIRPGHYAIGILVEHLWAARLREAVGSAGGRLLAQGFLTPEVVMIVGAEIQARADAEAALGSALVEALGILASRRRGSAQEAGRAAAAVVRVLAAEGFVHESDAPAAIDALATAGIIELATVEAAVMEAEDMLAGRPRPDDPD